MPLIIKKSSKKPLIVNSIKEMENPKKGLDPSYDDETKVLILGTFPGEESLEFSKYYNDNSNRFWPTISEIFDIRGTYSSKLKCLLDYGVGIWDIFEYAQRIGSEDNKIEKAMYNDIEDFLSNNQSIEFLVFNGKNTYDWLNEDYPSISGLVKLKRLQSTSGLNAHFKNGEDWEEFFRNYIELLRR